MKLWNLESWSSFGWMAPKCCAVSNVSKHNYRKRKLSCFNERMDNLNGCYDHDHDGGDRHAIKKFINRRCLGWQIGKHVRQSARRKWGKKLQKSASKCQTELLLFNQTWRRLFNFNQSICKHTHTHRFIIIDQLVFQLSFKFYLRHLTWK